MHDVCLYGHLSVDRIFVDFQETKSLGCIANCWRTFKQIAPDLDVGVRPTSIGESLIYVDQQSCQRYSNFVPDIKTQKPIIAPAKISHALYINKLTDTTWLSSLHGIITADVCAGQSINTDLLQYIDYFFISDEDAFADLNTMAKLTKGYVVLHTNQSSHVSNGQQEHAYTMPDNMWVHNSNVLGAGDMFASAFLQGILLNYDIQQIQKHAHQTTSKLIKIANEKI